jgi:RND family efflux transporter MFP subunit
LEWKRGVLLAASLLALAGCGGGDAAQAAQPGRGGRGGRAGGEAGGERVVPVELAVATRGPVARTAVLAGTVAPIRTVAVNNQLAGVLTAVLVEEGDRVRRGQVLARLDDTELRAQLRQAQAQFAVAERTWRRAQELRKGGIVTQAEFERDEAAYLAARASRDALRARAGYATVAAPIDGVVLTQTVERGDVVGAQTPLFTLGDVSTLVLQVAVSELDVPGLRVGDSVGVTVDALPGRPLAGSIRRIFPSADPETRLVPVEVALRDAGTAGVRPGFLARAAFTVGRKSDAVLVPLAAVTGAAGQQTAWVVRNGRAERRDVRTGAPAEGRVEILEGVEPGDSVVVAGLAQLRDGVAVRTATPPAADQSTPNDAGGTR